MLPEIGHFALILALLLACTQLLAVFFLRHNTERACALSRSVVRGQFILVLLSFVVLVYTFVTTDFSVAYVAMNAHRDLPLLYRLTAVWGSHEGSMLLWVLILGGWSVSVVHTGRRLPADFLLIVLTTLSAISVGFLLFILLTSNPFLRLLPDVPIEGQDLNPLLQDWGFLIHPPILYMGYVGFAVTFAFAIAALCLGRLERIWVQWIRPWCLWAWCFLTLGIVLGSWWAYRELGWGGFWFWDPVENASLMPWLVGTALIHSLIVTEKRQLFQSWTLLLSICVFSLSLLGTFLVRSGVLTSVHTFATDPGRGIFILIFLAVVVGAGFILYALRGTLFHHQAATFSPLSRETFLLINNLLLMVMVSTVFLGTLYPLIIDAFGAGKISVGPPYFNTLFVPFGGLLLALMGVAPHCRWRQEHLMGLWQRTGYALSVTVVAVTLVFMWQHPREWQILLGFLLAFWLFVTSVALLWRRWITHSIKQVSWGMLLAHVGVAVLVLGITVTVSGRVERDVKMQIGDSVVVGDYQFSLRSVVPEKGPNYQSTKATFQVYRHGQYIGILQPEKRFYPGRQIMMTDAAIQPGFFRDLYVSLGEPIDPNTWSVRAYYKPFVRWIWGGGLFMLFGGLIALWERRKYNYAQPISH